MGAVPRDITTQPHLCLTWAIGECSMQGEGWAGWGTGQMARGFLTQSESRAPQGRARYRPRGWGQRCSGLPVLAGAQRGSGTCRAPVAPWDTVVWQGWGLGRLCSGVPCPFRGHSPGRGWPSGRLGRDGPRAASSQGLRPLQACRHQCPNAFLAEPAAPIRALLTNPALAPSHLPHPLSYRPQLQAAPAPLP